jgi:hypothetical protein
MSNSAFTPTVLQNFAEASVSQSGIVNTTAQTFAGEKTFNGGVKLLSSGGTATNLNHYEEHSYTATWDISGNTATSTIAITRIGNRVYLDPGALVHTLAGVNDVFNLQVASYLPSRFRPASEIYTSVYVTDAGVVQTVHGLLVITVNGFMQLQKAMGGGNFTSPGIASLGSSAGNRLVSSIVYKV